MPFPSIETLGPRIWITGPAGGGKSTLAVALGRRLDLPVIHLDRLRFAPESNWVSVPEPQFLAATVSAEAGERWIVDGNYFGRLAQHGTRATGLINLSSPTLGNFARYVRRSLVSHDRAGRLAGAPERINWRMTRWILWDEPKRRKTRREQLRRLDLPLVETSSVTELKRLYEAWGLER